MVTLTQRNESKAHQLIEARRWIATCRWRDDLKFCLEDLTDDEVIKGIDRHYCGGWKQFGRDVEGGFVAD
jgi:hypothetical protein